MTKTKNLLGLLNEKRDGNMPDICMCLDMRCHKRSRCYRYLLKSSSPWQSMFKAYELSVDQDCPYFLDIKTYPASSYRSVLEVDNSNMTE